MNIKEYRKYYKNHGHPPPRKCKECGVDVSLGFSYCSLCRPSTRRKYTICGFEDCKEQRVKNKHSCEYHSSEYREKKFKEEIVSCNDCGLDIGERKDVTSGGRGRLCNDCREIRKKNTRKRQIKYSQKWFKEKYHNDEEFRLKYLEYQKNYTNPNHVKN